MGKIFNNKFFVLFVIVAFFFYFGPVHVANAGGALSTVLSIAVVVVAVVVFNVAITTILISTAAGLVANALFPCQPLVGFIAGAAAGGGVNAALETGQGPGLAGYGSGCGGGGGGVGATNPAAQQGTPGSPTLVNQTATPIVQGSCTTGFNLSYDVTDAYQYAIYRDGTLINQGVLQDYPPPQEEAPQDTGSGSDGD